MAMVSISTGKESKQDYATPPEFIEAVEARFGKIVFDLAASEHNRKCAEYYNEQQDSLVQDWVGLSRSLPQPGLMFLNPPFSNIGPWAQKCSNSVPNLASAINIAFLVPASVGSRWFENYLFNKPRCHVLFLGDRICFDGKHVFPKDCLLAIFGPFVQSAISIWRWKDERRRSHEQRGNASLLPAEG